VRCQRQRYQPQRHSPLGREIGTLSPAERNFGNTDRLPGKSHKTWNRGEIRNIEDLIDLESAPLPATVRRITCGFEGRFGSTLVRQRCR
jgi:hypothetical protein